MTMTQTLITPDLLQKIRACASHFGFDHLSVTKPTIPKDDQDAFFSWCADGFAGEMSYMTRDPKKRVSLTETYPGVRSVLTLGVSYYQGPLPEKPGKAYGRVARYAWGLDYHDVIQARLARFLVALDELIGGASQSPVAIDTKPVLERALAKSAGLGFVGKNTVLIISRNAAVSKSNFHVGSWVFLTEILLDIPLADDFEPPQSKVGCGGCTKCLTACPTDAFEKPYRLKADKCIAYLTIENKGGIPLDMRSQIGDWLFGCDVCQDVCPFNARAYETRWPEFQADQGVGAWMSLHEILAVPDQPAFKKRWGTTPLSRSKRKGLIRNACVVAGNSGDESLAPLLQNLLTDAEPLVRGHAVWGLSRLVSPARARVLFEENLKKETDSSVRQEYIDGLGLSSRLSPG